MGGITSSAKKKEMEREAELKKMTAARLAIFNKPPEPEDSSDEDSVYNSDRKDVKQLSLTENNVKVNSRKIKAPPEDAPATAVQAAKLDGPSYILDDRMIKVIEFMLDPEFDKVLFQYLFLHINEKYITSMIILSCSHKFLSVHIHII